MFDDVFKYIFVYEIYGLWKFTSGKINMQNLKKKDALYFFVLFNQLSVGVSFVACFTFNIRIFY